MEGATMKIRGTDFVMYLVSEPHDYSVCWAMEIHDPDGNLVILHQRADGSFGP